jgi:hypothetical protein
MLCLKVKWRLLLWSVFFIIINTYFRGASSIYIIINVSRNMILRFIVFNDFLLCSEIAVAIQLILRLEIYDY